MDSPSCLSVPSRFEEETGNGGVEVQGFPARSPSVVYGAQQVAEFQKLEAWRLRKHLENARQCSKVISSPSSLMIECSVVVQVVTARLVRMLLTSQPFDKRDLGGRKLSPFR